MRKWIQQYRKANSQTKLFIWTCIFYAVITAATTVYCYTRLDINRYRSEQLASH
ncbi:MAG: hypothetical protein H0X51_06750 [Parachlamydiaceae bacterium]|nr:hypothetical protein [Parachlamydiaceae bacterium]